MPSTKENVIYVSDILKLIMLPVAFCLRTLGDLVL